MNARAQTFADLARPLAAMARIAPDEQLRDMWRGSHREIADHLDMIPFHLAALAEGRNVAYRKAALATRLPAYREAIRRVTEAELEMTARGMAFAVSSDAWGDLR